MKRFFSHLQTRVAELHPAYFAMVMSTAIICMAFQMQGFRRVSLFLLWFNVVSYAVLWGLTLWRICAWPGRFMADLGNHRQGVGYFTVVAGTCLLGSQFMLVVRHPNVAAGLYLFGLALWLLLMYGIFTLFSVRNHKPSIDEAISGAWLLATVATQTVAVLGALLSSAFPDWKTILLFASVTMFFAGAILYIMIVTLIFYRLMFFDITPEGLTSPYWITMGADSITALAGAILATKFAAAGNFATFHPVVLGFALFYWSTATWWIPLLLLLGIWRYGIQRVPFRYNPGHWGMVYPIGVYTACTWRLAETTGLSFLLVIPRVTLYLAFLAWAITLAGLVHSGWKTLSRF